MTLRWFFSKTVRQTSEMVNQVRKLLSAQMDILSPQAIKNITGALDDTRNALKSGADTETLKAKMAALEEMANKWLKPYPNPAWRENVEVILVAVAIALSIRTFFLQPMKIPTGSMQPTLYGITYENLKDEKDAVIPTGVNRWVDSIFKGTSYYRYTASEDGAFRLLDENPVNVLPLITKQRFSVGSQMFTAWMPGDQLFRRAGLVNGQTFQKGEDILNMKVTSGDHLFVNRVVYNFRPPKRGEIVIFETRGIDNLPQDTYYIKRLVAIGGDQVQIGDDQHLRINGTRLTAATPHFENLYTFGPDYKENHYFGHVNQSVGSKFARAGTMMAPKFPDGNAELTVRSNHCLVMGDNTMNSYDSRYWGDFSQENIIGRSSFVYWPISVRFGWGQQ